MGCMVSKQHPSNKSNNLKGTTGLAFYTKKGIIVGIESRASNERDDELSNKLQIEDNTYKMLQISTKIISVFVGKRQECRELSIYIQQNFPYSVEEDEYYGPEPKVLDIVEAVYKHLLSLRGRNKECGLLIAGWDPESHDQIYKLIIIHDYVAKQKVSAPYGVLGSGHFHAANSLQKEGRCDNYDMSIDVAADLAGEALFNATMYDKLSGGPLRVWIVSKYGVRAQPVQDPLEAYLKYYDIYEEEKTLFLVSDITINPLHAYKFVQHFKQKGLRVLAAHCVAHRELGQQWQQMQRLSFHRIVFSSKDHASKAYELTGANSRTNLDDLVSRFPKQLLLTTVDPSVQLYLNRSSKDLLEFISRKFDGYLQQNGRPRGF